MRGRDVKKRWGTTNLVNLVAHDDLDGGFRNMGFELAVPLRECLKGPPVGNIVHWMDCGQNTRVGPMTPEKDGRNVPSITPCAPR